MYPKTYAFLAVNANAGTGVCWGHATFGGECSGVDLTGVTAVRDQLEKELNKAHGDIKVAMNDKDRMSKKISDTETALETAKNELQLTQSRVQKQVE